MVWAKKPTGSSSRSCATRDSDPTVNSQMRRQSFRRRYILRCRNSKIRRTSDPQSQRDRLETASLPLLWGPVDLRRASAGRVGEFGRHHFSSIWKDPTDPQWANDANTKGFLAWLEGYYPGGKPSEIFVYAGYAYAQILVYLLEQCGDDLSRENILRQAESFHGVTFPWLLPGITLDTSPTDHQAIKKLRETRFSGKTWELLDDQSNKE